MAENNGLSERELEILRLVATGASNKEIAQKLYISTNTVKVHLRNVFAKIGVASRTEAAMYAIQIGLVLAPVDNESVLQSELASQESDRLNIQIPVSERLDGDEQSLSRRKLWIRLALISLFVLISMGLILRVTGLIPSVRSGAPVDQPSAITQPRWETKSPMSVARYGMAAAAYADQIYLIGGQSERGVVNLNEQYDPANDQWIKRKPKPQPVTDVQSAVIGGKIYIPGGRLPTASVTDILEIYDPREDSWEQGAPLPVPLSAYALVAFEGKLYVFGGWDGSRYREEVYSYDPERKSWSAKKPMLLARGYLGAVVSNGKIYVMGGYNGKDILDANHLYSPEDDNAGRNPWQNLKPIPQGRYAMGMANVADRVYVVGGIGIPGEPLPDLEYQIESNVWRQKADTPFRDWSDLRLVTFGSRIFSYGGRKADSPVANQMVYQPFYTVLFPIVQ